MTMQRCRTCGEPFYYEGDGDGEWPSCECDQRTEREKAEQFNCSVFRAMMAERDRRAAKDHIAEASKMVGAGAAQ